ncbi:MAG: hypothetical protein IPO35_12145 [Uliginosibacterium sp.]|nr:hypothetical protein [Uliginosibacterium sp.]
MPLRAAFKARTRRTAVAFAGFWARAAFFVGTETWALARRALAEISTLTAFAAPWWPVAKTRAGRALAAGIRATVARAFGAEAAAVVASVRTRPGMRALGLVCAGLECVARGLAVANLQGFVGATKRRAAPGFSFSR